MFCEQIFMFYLPFEIPLRPERNLNRIIRIGKSAPAYNNSDIETKYEYKKVQARNNFNEV